MSDLRKLAEDIAADSGQTVDEAMAALRQALTGEVPPIDRMRRAPWWWRLPIPLRWRQKRVLASLREDT